MAQKPGEGAQQPPFSSVAAARLSLRNRPTPSRILAVAEYGYSLRFVDPPAGAEWCRVAAEMSTDQLHPSIRGRVLGYFGNSLRVVGHYDEAREVLERALKILPGEPLLLEFKASVLRDIRQLEEAAVCLRDAAKVQQASGDIGGLARTMLIIAQVMDQAGKSEDAAEFCLTALDLLDSSVDPTRDLLRTVVQNYAAYLCHAGKPLAALRALRTAEPLLEGGGPYFQLRLEWLFGKIAATLGDESAEVRLESVRQQLVDGGLLQEAALATLDLAWYYARQGDPRAAPVALSVAPLLEALGIERDAREAELLGQLAMTDANVEPLISELYTAIAWRPVARRVS